MIIGKHWICLAGAYILRSPLSLVRAGNWRPCNLVEQFLWAGGPRCSDWASASTWQSWYAHRRHIATKWIHSIPYGLLELHGRILIQELFNIKIASSHTNVYLVLLNSYAYLLAAKPVNSGVHPDKHNLQLALIMVVVNKLCQCLVCGVTGDWHVLRCPLPQLGD